jgi:hypothetical protein
MGGTSAHRNESPGSLGGGDRVDWCNGNALGSHPAGAQFDLRREIGFPGSFFMTLFTPSKANAMAASYQILSQMIASIHPYAVWISDPQGRPP